jgi:hypothetical protein
MPSNNPFLEEAKGVNLDTFDPKLLNNLEFIFKDVMSGDPDALLRPEFTGLNVNQLKSALEFVLANQDLDENGKADLLSNSWRLNYRDRPPTPEEFLTEKYLGPVAPTIWPQVKQAFIDFMNPTAAYRTAILYSFIGFGKSYLAILLNMYVGVHLSMMRSPWRFFGHSQPLDCKVLTPKGYLDIGGLSIGDRVVTPEGKETKIVEIHPQGVIPTYEIELDDGRKTRCSAQHLWKVSYKKDTTGEKLWEIVDTQFIIDHPELEFELPEAPQYILKQFEATN